MKFPSPLIPATLRRRYKRFLSDVTFEDGTTVTAHCPNSGSMLGLSDPGLKVWVSHSDSKTRKHAHTLELIELPDGNLAGVNTGRPNAIVAEGIEARRIAPLSGYSALRREVRYGRNSRIDILLQADGRPDCYVEVKNVHLVREAGLAEFPDSVSSNWAIWWTKATARSWCSSSTARARTGSGLPQTSTPPMPRPSRPRAAGALKRSRFQPI